MDAAKDPNQYRPDYVNCGPELDAIAPGGDLANLEIPWAGILQQTVTEPFGPPFFHPKAPDFWYLSGTSQAAPHVSALAALMKSVDPSLSPAEIRDAIKGTADPLGNSDEYGAGIIKPAAALSFGINSYYEIEDSVELAVSPDEDSTFWRIRADAGIVELSASIPSSSSRSIELFLYDPEGYLVASSQENSNGDSVELEHDVKLQAGEYIVEVRTTALEE